MVLPLNSPISLHTPVWQTTFCRLKVYYIHVVREHVCMYVHIIFKIVCTCTCMYVYLQLLEIEHTPSLVLKARHLSDSAFCKLYRLEVPEQALGGTNSPRIWDCCERFINLDVLFTTCVHEPPEVDKQSGLGIKEFQFSRLGNSVAFPEQAWHGWDSHRFWRFF